ncbi:uncharacterized protein BJ171DRAFT_473445 [Polychytrium aggregatum]|uniref:uncharacterized protein n=1 Tax=Polychytrium aggregatum TaxID=110093 RepID=UPI0022FDDB32|nr:uncharacterized protein BJ171DRAFT_473445 [Polychytrium aggregatum]KAI9206444.1 hypothetical protein BJ171DRAFT_473445 [Polychytrium aggregatum]
MPSREDQDITGRSEQTQSPPDSNKPITILVLGETGVGKSTLINAIANYLTYESLEQASASGGPVNLVPARFSLVDPDTFEAVDVTSTTLHLSSPAQNISDNEKYVEGQSTTQFPQSYLFDFENDDEHRVKIRVIDTSGMGDTRGIAQDKKNMTNIVDHITRIGEIHGIVMIVPASQNNIAAWLRFCVLELLQYFDREVVENLVFVFTKARSTFFQMGETKTALQSLFAQIETQSGVKIPIDDCNSFLVDNESYRYLLAERQMIETDENIQLLQYSWRKSTAAVRQLMKRVQDMKPHDLRPTARMRKLRSCLQQLTPKLLEFHRMKAELQAEIDQLGIKIQQISKKGAKIADTSRDISVPSYYPNGTEICAHPDCITEVQVNGIRHRISQPTKAFLENVNNSQFSDGAHPSCGHPSSYRETVNFVVDVKKPKTTTIGQVIIGGITYQLLSAAEELRRLREKLNRFTASEAEVIKEVAACSVYIRKHSVVIRNETFLDSADFEEIKLQAYNHEVVDEQKLEMLDVMKARYDSVRMVLEGDQSNSVEAEKLEEILVCIESKYWQSAESEMQAGDLEWVPPTIDSQMPIQ